MSARTVRMQVVFILFVLYGSRSSKGVFKHDFHIKAVFPKILILVFDLTFKGRELSRFSMFQTPGVY
jgi:hypothetical protein